MLSKTMARATAAAILVLLCGCSVPWKGEPTNEEVNLAFTLRENLIELHSVTVGGSAGRMILGSAAPSTVIDASFSAPRRNVLMLGSSETVQINPLSGDLQGTADAIIGADAWQNQAVTIDYHSGLVTLQKGRVQTWEMMLYRSPGVPMIEVVVDGVKRSAVVDTTSPDTLVLPANEARRGTAQVSIAGTDFGLVDVQYAQVSQPRVGNRLLSRFLVSIDYGRHIVGLWRDPRTPLKEPEPETPAL